MTTLCVGALCLLLGAAIARWLCYEDAAQYRRKYIAESDRAMLLQQKLWSANRNLRILYGTMPAIRDARCPVCNGTGEYEMADDGSLFCDACESTGFNPERIAKEAPREAN